MYLAIKAAHKYEVIHIIIYLLWVAAQCYVLCAMCYVLLQAMAEHPPSSGDKNLGHHYKVKVSRAVVAFDKCYILPLTH